MSMTYSLFEFVKEKLDELMEGQPKQIIQVDSVANALRTSNLDDDGEGESCSCTN
jgi:hypothetical protein